MFKSSLVIYPFIYSTLLLCQGCVGTAFMHEEDNQPQGQFIPLQEVPDRPAPPAFDKYQDARAELHDTQVEKN